MAAVGYFQLGDHADANIVQSICNGGVKIAIEIILLLHFVAAFPIMTNPPNQYFEEVLGIPKSKKLRKGKIVLNLDLFFSLQLEKMCLQDNDCIPASVHCRMSS